MMIMALLIAVVNLMGGVRASTRCSVSNVIRRAAAGGGGGGRQQHGNHRSLLLSNSVAFSSSFSTKHRYHQSISITTLQYYSSPYVNSRYCGYHSTPTSLLAATARKRNGGKRKKKPVMQGGGSSGNNLDNVVINEEDNNDDDDTNEEQTLITHNDDDINTILNHNNAKDEVSQFAPIFASEYHAPVMPTECINALLQRGEWYQMLLERKERRRKRMRILEAKRKRTELYDDDDDDDDDEGDDDKDDDDEDVDRVVAQRSSSPSSSEVSISNNSQIMHPRLFIDGTLGGGGHSQALLQELSDGDILIGCDVDPEALSTASERLFDYLATCDYILDKNNKPSCGWVQGRPMFIPVQSNFRNLATVLSKVRHPMTGKLLLGNRGMSNHNSITTDVIVDSTEEIEFPRGVNGMLLDLGVSSHQIDVAERGFAFMKEGPLDMRMSGNSQSSILTAADICNEFDEASLIDILRTYGDEPRARRIVSAIMASRPLTTTTDLVHAINTVTPTFARQKRAGLIATSARVFQALRIVVNEEDAALKEVLENVAPWALARSALEGDGDTVDGILAVLSYHSMEDKMAKRVIRDGKVDFFEKGSIKRRGGGGSPERDLYGNIIDYRIKGSINLPFEPLTRPRKATDEEVAANSRSRSATLRVAIRI
jgi:16S rRNA (cytosine1402-N4)-methyltransferase